MSIFGFIGDVFSRLTGGPTAAQRKKQKEEMNAQIRAYQQQTEITKKELAAKKDQEDAEKRRIEEKQIRALRRNNRAQGFLGTTQEQQPGITEKLGG